MSNLDENSSYEVYSLQKFAEAMLYSSIKSPSKEILKIHRSLVLERDRYDSKADDYGIFKMIKDLTENGEMLCYVKQSLHQLIYNVYKVLYLTQLKGFSIVEFSRLILQTNGLGNFQNEYKKQKDQFENKINMQILSLKSMLSSSNNIYWRCDPYSHKKDVSYYEVAPILQGFIENEVHMSPQHSCKQNCAFYEHSPVYRCSSNQFCAKQHSCNGELLNCQYIESDMNVCQSPFGSSRRYEYITYKKGTVLGDRSINCNGTYSKVNSWWRWLVWHCSYCLCICYSTDTASDQYFSLQPSLSDISQNKIVTGVKFNKVNNIFHLQVQEGILGPRGYINESSRSWVTLLRPEFIYNNSLPQEGVDFFKLSYFSRTIDIDNVMAPKTTVVTGVKFRSIGTHISIEIRVTPFDFSSGNLIQPNIKSYWVGNEDANFSNVERTEIKIDNSDLPTKLKIPSVPDMTAHKYVKFTHSSITRDVAQTTLPFIDKQTVEPFPAIPLSGVGIYFKGIENYGGFIGANVFTYNFSTHISTRLI
ncbi:uncharacterized protein LOC126900066 isoform X2 [Daktulosphaira vitifoliae]|nr:uncharacterized protein LOC126900066 isoform X2 [Daktulosphaira vitifoliae]